VLPYRTIIEDVSREFSLELLIFSNPKKSITIQQQCHFEAHQEVAVLEQILEDLAVEEVVEAVLEVSISFKKNSRKFKFRCAKITDIED
jgi:hypothetical protein